MDALSLGNTLGFDTHVNIKFTFFNCVEEKCAFLVACVMLFLLMLMMKSVLRIIHSRLHETIRTWFLYKMAWRSHIQRRTCKTIILILISSELRVPASWNSTWAQVYFLEDDSAADKNLFPVLNIEETGLRRNV